MFRHPIIQKPVVPKNTHCYHQLTYVTTIKKLTYIYHDLFQIALMPKPNQTVNVSH